MCFWRSAQIWYSFTSQIPNLAWILAQFKGPFFHSPFWCKCLLVDFYLVTSGSKETLVSLFKELLLFLIGAICPIEKSTSLTPALLFLTSITPLLNWKENNQLLHLNQLLLSVTTPRVTQVRSKLKKCMISLYGLLLQKLSFTQFNLFNPNKVWKMKGIQINQKSNWTATSRSKEFFLCHHWRERQGVYEWSWDPV